MHFMLSIVPKDLQYDYFIPTLDQLTDLQCSITLRFVSKKFSSLL